MVNRFNTNEKLLYGFNLFLVLQIFSTISFGQIREDSIRGGNLYLEKSTFDFGDVIQGPNVFYIISFKNIGQDTLVIDHIGTQCGCIVPTWDKSKKYGLGEGGEIKIEFDTKRKMGLVNSPIHIFYDNYRKKKTPYFRINILKP